MFILMRTLRFLLMSLCVVDGVGIGIGVGVGTLASMPVSMLMVVRSMAMPVTLPGNFPVERFLKS